ncbi:MAG: hypothetical protein AB2563_20165 [Candidatus Thiodiazotropha endolucinida]
MLSTASKKLSLYVSTLAVCLMAANVWAGDRFLTIDDAIRGATQQKQMARPGSERPAFPMTDGMIDVNKIPDSQPSRPQQQPDYYLPPSASDCTETMLFGTGGYTCP